MISTPHEHSPEAPLEDALEQDAEALPEDTAAETFASEEIGSVGSTFADPADVIDQRRVAPVDEEELADGVDGPEGALDSAPEVDDGAFGTE